MPDKTGENAADRVPVPRFVGKVTQRVGGKSRKSWELSEAKEPFLDLPAGTNVAAMQLTGA